MKPPADPIRISSLGREQLIKLKRQTGIANWNILCRWAICCSLREKSTPPQTLAGGDAGVEMTWKVFAGEQADALAALVYLRAPIDGFSNDSDGASQCLRAHLHRGLGYLASESGNPGITGFIDRWLNNKRKER
jgi:DNA sulfur modification protein DndE